MSDKRSPSAPPLNEVFGNSEQLPLNEPSGDSGQLASLEQGNVVSWLQWLVETVVADGAYADIGQKDVDRVRTFRRQYEAALSAQARGADSLLTEAECGVIETLLQLAYAAWCLGDDSEHREGGEVCVPQESFDEMAKHLDALEELPDDQPGYTMGEAAKARWALRRLLSVPPAAPQPREVLGVDELADRIADHLCEQEYDIGGRDELRQHIRDVLATTPQDAAGVDAGNADEAHRLLREVVDNLEGVGCGPCIGSYAPMEDLHGRIERYLSTQRTDDWHPIETAPKDGTEILLSVAWDGGRACEVATWEMDGWRDADLRRVEIGSSTATHWMPLPAPPSPAEARDGE